MQITCEYHKYMSIMIQIRNVPDELHHKLKARAALAGKSLSEYLLTLVRASTEQPTPQEMAERLSRRRPVKLKLSPAEAVRQERDRR